MAVIRATRAPAGSARSTARAAVGAVALPIWPGITSGHDSRCACTWAPHQGVMQVKYRNAMCVLHGGLRHE